MAVTISPQTGLINGGTQVVLVGPELDMSGGADDFSGGALGALWDDVSVNSGAVIPRPGSNELELDTGTVALSEAGIQTKAGAAEGDIDAGITFQQVSTTLSGYTWTANLAELALVDLSTAGTEFRILIERDGALRKRTVEASIGGNVTRAVVDFPAKFDPTSKAVAVLRLLRIGSRVIAHHNGRVVFDTTWVSNSAVIRIRTANTVTDSRAVTRISGWRRRPVVAFERNPSSLRGVSEPLVGMSYQSDARTIGLTPEISATKCRNPLVADVRVVGYGGATDTIADGFTFTLREELIQFRDVDKVMTICNDTTLRRRR